MVIHLAFLQTHLEILGWFFIEVKNSSVSVGSICVRKNEAKSVGNLVLLVQLNTGWKAEPCDVRLKRHTFPVDLGVSVEHSWLESSFH